MHDPWTMDYGSSYPVRMTRREQLALSLTAAGAGQIVASAYGYGGWRAGCLVGGVLTAALGVLLGFEDVPTGGPDDGEEAGAFDFEYDGRDATAPRAA